MSITIENPTAEAALEAIQKLPASELERLKVLLSHDLNADTPYWEDPTYSGEWSDEDLRDAQRATSLLIEKRFGPEEGDYD